MKKRIIHYISICLTILFIVLLTTKFKYVFGSDTDWINQHTVIPDYFRNIFYKTGKILPNFSFNYGAGQNIYNLSYYGLLNPIILPSYLLPFISMSNYIIIVNIILLIVTGILFYKFINNNFDNENISLVTTLIFILAAPLIFHMHRHIMFVNYMPFLIMSLMGVDKLFKEKNKSFLIISIFLMIMTSYYYSVCGILVVCIYYLYKYLLNNKKIKIKELFKNIFIFIGIIFVAILMSMILLLPTVYTLLIGRGAGETSINLIDLFIPYLKIHKIFCGTYAIGLSLIGFVALLYLFFTRKKENVITASIITIVLFIPIFRYILNGGLYLREKCFIPFLPLLAFFIAKLLKDLFNNKIEIKKFVIYLLIILIPLYYFNQREYCYLIITGFIILLILYNKIKCKKIISLYLITAALFVAIYENNKEDLVKIEDYNKIFSKEVANTINNTINNDQSYYRSNNLIYPTKIVNKIYNDRYLTTNIYSSTYNKDYLNFIRNIFKTSEVDFNYFMISSPNDLLFNTFMGVKYLYSDYDVGLGYQKINDITYVNNNTLPLIYATSHIINEDEFDLYDYPYQKELLLKNVVVENKNTINKIDSMVEKIDLKYNITKNNGVEIKKEDDKYILEVKDKGNLTLELENPLENQILFISIKGLKENSCSIDNISMKINNVENILTCSSWIYANKNNTFHYVISDKKINKLEITLNKGKYYIENIDTYILNYNSLNNIKDNIYNFNITSMKNDTIKGDISVDEDTYLTTSIPYDNGFTIKVNGKEIDYEKVNKAFLGFPLKKGSYNIEISYKSPLLKEGIIISIIGLGIFIVLLLSDIKKSKKCKLAK